MSRWSGLSVGHSLPGPALPGHPWGRGTSCAGTHEEIFTKMSSQCLVSTLGADAEPPYLPHRTIMPPRRLLTSKKHTHSHSVQI